MKKSLFVMLILFSVLAMSGCELADDSSTVVSSISNSTSIESSAESSSNVQSKAETVTAESLAKAKQALIWELDQSYNFETQKIGADGINHQIGGLSVRSVSYFNEFDVGSEKLQHVIAFDTVGDDALVKEFLTDHAFVSAVDQSGQEYSAISSGIYSDKDADKLYMLFYADDDLSGFQFIVLGGFASDKNNGYSNVVFEVK